MRVRRTGSSRLRMAVAYDHAQTRHARRRRADRRRVRALLRDARLSPEAPYPRGERRLPRRRRGPAGLHLLSFPGKGKGTALRRKRGCVAVEFTDGSGNEEKSPDVRYRWTSTG